MQLPDSNSPLWILLRQLALYVLMFSFFLFAYHNKMSQSDIMMYVTIASSVLGIDLTKRFGAPNAPPEEKK